eukprot:CAMPEP_0168741710 /NCGR_PEP_ID=MMETSP0724-20121128/12662_1 /TAXON_ID=265536 /ORGANISM="Amphiprora sp., Strain CCMP467" /LENGTH=307 /DNA_ID=CAMNT_0008789239 /DNA_START=238 /DNA_END=1158 /DNA_ORIENTATION=-
MTKMMRQNRILFGLALVAALSARAVAFAPTTSSSRATQKQFLFTQQQTQPFSLEQPTVVTKRTTNYAQRIGGTSLQATGGFAMAGALAGCLTGGFFAGGLHAIAGPDHLAALLPRCCGQRWYRAGRVGALWGMGHGVSATIIGVLAFALKNTFSNNSGMGGVKRLLSGASHITEVAVGLSLILIGVMGIREAREWKDEIETVQPQSLSAAAVSEVSRNAAGSQQKRAVIFNGLLHGFSWDGAPSLAPAIAVATWSGNLAFLSAYAAGTMAAMALVTTLVGEGTRRAGQFFDRPDIPQKLSLFSSVLA